MANVLEVKNYLVENSVRVFREKFGGNPDAIVQAPGRVNLIGEHTDYNDGFVLPCAIDFQTVVTASRRHDTKVNVIAVDYHCEFESFDLDQSVEPCADRLWANYIRGMVKYLQINKFSIAGADIVVSGNIPQGAGLSSSASLLVAVGQMFNVLFELDIAPQFLALIAQQAENNFVGCNCGIMDQLVSAKGEKGRALLLDCRSLKTQTVSIPKNLSIVIINSNVKRGLVDSEYNLRRRQCEQVAAHFQVKALRDIPVELFNRRSGELNPTLAKRARHVISENVRTLAAAKALASNDSVSLGALMEQSHISMRDDFEITVPAVDTLVDIIKNCIGTRGGVRMTGGGFGGCVIVLVASELVEEVSQTVVKQYQNATGLKESIYLCNASSAAGEIENFKVVDG